MEREVLFPGYFEPTVGE
ncbi:hypothetical protein AYI70_g10502, partial [Smittium culicis]